MIAAALLSGVMAGCALRAGAVPFADSLGRVSELRAERRPVSERRAARLQHIAPNALAPALGVDATALFRLGDELSVSGRVDGGLFVELEGQATNVTVELYDLEGTAMWFEEVLLEGTGIRRHEFQLPRDRLISGLRIVSGGESGALELLAAGARPVTRRLSFSAGLAVTTSHLALVGVHRIEEPSVVPQRLAVAMTPELWSSMLAKSWLLTLRLQGVEGARANVTLFDQPPPLQAGGGEGGSTRFHFRLRSGESFVHIPSALVAFQPRGLRMDGTDGTDVGVLSVSHEPLAALGEDGGSAIPADAEAILAIDPTDWRQPAFELYTWNAAPSSAPVLIFDTRDYRAQAAMFRRLAFFAEKRGYRGFVHSDEALEGRRGWNAHDYTATDLAEFYTLAAVDGVALTDDEVSLRQLLVSQGLIRPAGSGWRAEGGGAVLSISQESSSWLRRVLLSHELLHGVFFTVPAFEAAAGRIWRALTEPTRQFLRLLLRHIGYDEGHERLAINEFMAYTLQQSRDRLVEFLQAWGQRLRSRYPRDSDLVAEVIADRDTHLGVYDQMQSALLLTTGLDSEQLAFMSVE